MKMKFISVFFLFISISFNTTGQQIIFTADYEDPTKLDELCTCPLLQNGVCPCSNLDRFQDFSGGGTSMPDPNNWDDVPNYENYLPPGRIHNEMTGTGCADTNGDMRAEIGPDPADPTNPDKKTLRFVVEEHNDKKARVQLEFRYPEEYANPIEYDNNGNEIGFQPNYQTGNKHFKFTTRLYVPDHWEAITNQSSEVSGFMTIMEFFNSSFDEAFEAENHPASRISLKLMHVIDGSGSSLRWGLKADEIDEDPLAQGVYKWLRIWPTVQGDPSAKPTLISPQTIPFNTWMTLEIEIKEGDVGMNNGQVIFTVDDTEIWNFEERMMDSDDDLGDGFHFMQPHKLYVADDIVNIFKFDTPDPEGLPDPIDECDANNTGNLCQLYWDDLIFENYKEEIYDCKHISATNLDAGEDPFTHDTYIGGQNQQWLAHGKQWSGFIFDELDIPKEANIISSRIRFKAEDDYSGTSTTEIYGHKVQTPPVFTGTNSDISSRVDINDGDPTDADGDWNITTWKKNKHYFSPDITPIVKEIYDAFFYDSGIAPGDRVSIIFKPDDPGNSADRRFDDWSNDPYDPEFPELIPGRNSAQLCVVWENPGVIQSDIHMWCDSEINPSLPVEDVNVEVVSEVNPDPCGLSPILLQTDANGDYNAILCSEEGKYTITPTFPDGVTPLAGISTLDIIKIHKHILGVELFTSPFEWIAADANASKSVSAIDIVEIRKVFLFIKDDFTQACNTGLCHDYFFVNGSDDVLDYDLSNWLYSLPGEGFNSVQHSITENSGAGYIIDPPFVAVKTGDVNCSWEPSEEFTDPGEDDVFVYFEENTRLETNDYVDITFQVTDFTDIAGYQFGIGFDETKLQYISTSSASLRDGAESEYWNTTTFASGMLRTVWTHDMAADTSVVDTTLNAGAGVFVLRFMALNNIPSLQAAFSFDDNILPNVAYEVDGSAHPLKLNGLPPIAAIKDSKKFIAPVNQNTVTAFPNPTNGDISFDIRLTENAKASIKVFDQTGREVINSKMDLTSGGQVVHYSDLDHWADGFYYYQISINENTFTGKILKKSH